MFLLIARHPFQKVNSSITTSQKIYTNVIEKNQTTNWCGVAYLHPLDPLLD